MGDLNGRVKSLAVGPMVESCEPVAARIEGGKGAYPSMADPDFDGLHVEVAPDSERSPREFDPEGQRCVNVPVTVPLKADRSHGVVEHALRRFPFEDEIEI